MAHKRKADLPKPIVVKQNEDTLVRLEKVEPPNWWTGMTCPNVTLMLQGRNVGLTRPRMSANGVTVTSVRQTDSVNHLFVDLAIGPEAEPGAYGIELHMGNATVAKIDYELKKRQTRQRTSCGVTREDSIYLVMPDRFAQKAGCGTDERTREKINRKLSRGRHGGNLGGIRQHVDYLHALGVTALWLTPVATNDMDHDSFHGYAATDYYGVDPRLGTIDDYKQLSASLSQWGIKLIMDIVVNHCGTRHPWMLDAPGSGWFNDWEWKPELTNYRPGVATDIHASQYDKRRTIEGWFDQTMADLNMANPLVQDYMSQMAIWWVETVGLNGLRIDTFPYSDAEGLRHFTSRIKLEYPELAIIGETWVSDAAKLAPWTRTGLTSAMDFPTQEAMTRAFTEDFAWGAGANRLYDAISNDHIYHKPENLMTFGDNHDTGRLLTRLGNDTAALRLAMAFLLTTRGIPQIYYGTEMLMDGESATNDADIRRDMPGGWDGDKEDWFALAQERDPDKKLTAKQKERREMFDYTSRLLKFRRRSQGISNGELTHFLPTENVYTYIRHCHGGAGGSGDTVMVVLNLERKRAYLNIERFAEITGDALTGVDILTGRRYEGSRRIAVPPRTALVIDVAVNAQKREQMRH